MFNSIFEIPELQLQLLQFVCKICGCERPTLTAIQLELHQSGVLLVSVGSTACWSKLARYPSLRKHVRSDLTSRVSLMEPGGPAREGLVYLVHENAQQKFSFALGLPLPNKNRPNIHHGWPVVVGGWTQ